MDCIYGRVKQEKSIRILNMYWSWNIEDDNQTIQIHWRKSHWKTEIQKLKEWFFKVMLSFWAVRYKEETFEWLKNFMLVKSELYPLISTKYITVNQIRSEHERKAIWIHFVVSWQVRVQKTIQ